MTTTQPTAQAERVTDLVMEILKNWTTEDNFSRKKELVFDIISDFPTLNHKVLAKQYNDWLLDNPTVKNKQGKKRGRDIGRGYRTWCENKQFSFDKTKIVQARIEKKGKSHPLWINVTEFLKSRDPTGQLYGKWIEPLKITVTKSKLILTCPGEEHRQGVLDFWSLDLDRAVRYSEGSYEIEYRVEEKK